ncbi:hypothetical protein AB0L06_38195 [Spirillospora sp. NPDC052269]
MDAGDIAARLIVRTCLQSGLAVVYQDLLDFAGDEITLTREPAVTGRAFGEVLHLYPRAAVVGIRRARGPVEPRPPMDAVFEDGDEVTAISAAGDAGPVRWDGEIVERAAAPPPDRGTRPSRTLMLGWNRRAAGIVRRLDAHVTAGSRLDVVADLPDGASQLDEARPDLTRLDVAFALGDTGTRAALEACDPASYGQVIVLYDEDDAQYADSRALITLLHLRQMQAGHGRRCAIVSEMSDERNRRLAQVTRADDFVVGDKLLSLLMVRLSEDRHLADVLDHLFDPGVLTSTSRPSPTTCGRACPWTFTPSSRPCAAEGTWRSATVSVRRPSSRPPSAWCSTRTRASRSPSPRTTGSSFSPRTAPPTPLVADPGPVKRDDQPEFRRRPRPNRTVPGEGGTRSPRKVLVLVVDRSCAFFLAEGVRRTFKRRPPPT